MIYPIGSVYMSLNNVNPSAMFGGSWQELTGSYIKLGGDGTIAHNCKTSCHVTVSNDGQNPCPTNCNFYVSGSDIYQGNRSFYYDGIPSCESDNYYSSCGLCHNDCFSNHNCGNNVGGEAIGISGCSVGEYFVNYYACYNGCVGCVGCYYETYTYYDCHSCNSACHSCNSNCNSCNSNCHGSVGESFNIMYVHMWKRVG